MITVGEAKTFVETHTQLLSPVTMPVGEALGFVLATNIYADQDIPAFNQSSMDGYAFAFHDWVSQEKLIIEGEIPAGASIKHTLPEQHAMRIFTGAAVPEGADTVVMQEKTIIKDNELFITDDQLKKGNSVRERGSEVTAGAIALEKNTVLSPAAIGFLTGIGNTRVQVYASPRICIIVTGNELQQPGKPLQHGQVYESNSFALKAALQQLHITDINIVWVNDDPKLLQKALQDALRKNDMILLTGGISVGDYDYVLESATACGVEKLFHRVKQRPGKPLYFGKKDKQLVFGLPGNPSSVLTCFYEYVLPAIQKMRGHRQVGMQKKYLELTHNYIKNTGLTHFLKGACTLETVRALDAQESYRMSSFANANCLICLREDQQEWKVGDRVEVHLLPGL